ncbi:cubilin homolog isoform X2 [Drosophila miranda]|uniref:cubilin homolog isoform X2 n=1 Tax=Drosophila miranda TaxID=7229 RepID=UPI0007E6A73D|nr:cubilin homolog isoform X2 [Drosophila miranda]
MRSNTLNLLFVLVLCVFLLELEASSDERAERAVITRQQNGNLLLEAAPDQNVTFRLMGEQATVMINDVDILTLLRRRLQVVTARQVAARREPLSLDVQKDQFRVVQRSLTRLEKRFFNMRNNTRRGGLNQRVLRRQLQRVERVSTTLARILVFLAKDECLSSPCQNGGTCYDEYRAFQCDCAAGWQGPTCEDDVNECFDLAGTDLAACMNSGRCINTPGSFRCVCRNGYTGTHCRLRQNKCLAGDSSEMCGEHGTCVHSVSTPAGYVCVCDQGWTWADNNATTASASPCTRDVDECVPSMNPCHNECINLPGSYRCGACPPGYTGDGRLCRDIDECTVANGGCSLRPRVTCINTEGSHLCGRCPVGWTGDGRSCTAAESNSCDGERICHSEATCEYISGTVVCTCPLGSYGHGYGEDGCTKDPSRDTCDQHLCQNNATCIHIGRGSTCICQPGYKGVLCNDTDSDGCHPSPCLNGGTCRLLPSNQYQCNCPAGYTGTRCSNQRFFCGSTLRGPTGQLHFPPNTVDGDYQPDERCPFIIRTPPGHVLNVTFTQFDLQESNDCAADFLQLHDGPSLAYKLFGRFCGTQLVNRSIISTQEQVFFWFRSDNGTQGSGFHLTWSSLPFSCGDTLANLTLGQSGILRSPGYPGRTRSGLDCRWQLTAPYGTRLVLRFYDITLESGGGSAATVNCSQGLNSSYLAVYDSDRQLLKSCVSAQPEPLYSSSNSLQIDLHTASVRADSSFQLHYEVVAGQPGCGGSYMESHGRISGHMDAEVCLYLIEQPRGTQIKLEFEHVNLLRSGDCRLQKIEIFNGRTDESPLMRRLCGQPEGSEMEPLISSGNFVLVRYEYALNGLRLKKSFELSYSRVCSGSFGGMAGTIKTPNYPQSYLDDMTCTFKLVGPLDSLVKLTIKDLSLGADSNAIDDGNQTNYLDVYLSSDEKRRIYKTGGNLVLMAHTNQATLVFRGSSSGRGLLVDYSFPYTGCGGYLTQTGTKSILKRVTGGFCQWIIDVPGRKEIKVNQMIMHGQFFVYDNSTSPGLLLNSYESDFEEYFDADLLTLIVRDISSLSLLHIFYRQVESDCTVSSSQRYGIIKSPNWPRPYGASQTCEWIIRAPLGQRLELVVSNFSLEAMGNECYSDYLEIRNGDSAKSPLIGRYCGTRIPPRVPSFGNALFLSFVSDSSVEESGFLLNWQQAGEGCGGKLSSPVGSIHSPHSMAGNRGALACDWQIILAEGSRVTLQIESQDENLCSGHLTIFDGPTTSSCALPLRCNETSSHSSIVLHSSSNRVLVRYDVGHDSPDGTSFVLDYATNCRVRLENLQGAVETPNFPENYPPDTSCEWDISAGGGRNHIHLVFSHLSVEQYVPGICDFDYVMLSDMKDDQLLEDRRLCSNEGVAPLTSKGNRLLLKFSSDATLQAKGFRAEYKRIGCGEHLQEMGGHFESPNAPFSVDVDCDWVISAPEGKQIRLVLQELYINPPQRECSDDVLSVSAPGGHVLYRSCQVETSSQTFTSPGNELHVHFHSSPTVARKYFRATYAQVPANCGGYVRASSGVIATPGFHYATSIEAGRGPLNYSSNVECLWVVEVSESYGIRLWFERFNLTNSANCSGTFVELTKLDADNTEHFLERGCGEEQPLIRLVHGQRMRVLFKAPAGSWGSFALHFERQCGGALSAGEGYLRSRLDEDCSWLVVAPEGSKLSLNINQLECPGCASKTAAENCTAEVGLQLLNDDDQVVLYSLCSEHPANLVVPASNVRILAKGIALAAQFSSLENTCGGNISLSSARGSLSSPNYPDSYPANVECLWRVGVNAGNSLAVTFDALNIVPSEHCNEDFLEMRSGVDERLLGLYCDRKMPEQPLVIRSQLWLKFRSMPGNSADGFKLHWSYVHDNEITSETNGTIESPPIFSVRAVEQAFSWRIFVEREMVVALNFEEYISGLQLFDGYDDTALEIAIESSPWQFTSSSNVLYLRTLNTDFNAFRLKWSVVSSALVKGNRTVQNDECNKEFTVSASARLMVNSPGYPKGYAPNLYCQWTFRPEDSAQHVYTDLYEADLEVFPNCFADYLNIQSSRDMNQWTNDLRICNGSKGGPLIQRLHGTPHLRLQFKSDVSINGRGFRAIVRATCGSNMTAPVATILDTQMRAGLAMGSNCEWHIEVRPGRKIEISIAYARSAVNVPCPVYGLIYDGLDDRSPLFQSGKFCNQIGFNKDSYRTSGSHAYIKYVLPPRSVNPAHNYWNITYREYSECDGEIQLTQLASTYSITTPGYPYLPHPHTECTWLVVAPPGEVISATFDDRFDLSLRQCEKETVELFDGSTTLARQLLHTCRRPPKTLRSSGSLLLVHYQTQLDEPHGGFRLNVSLSACGGLHTSAMGFISSENYPALGGYPRPAVCEYSIKLPRGSYIRLNISDLHVPYSPQQGQTSNSSDRLEFVDLADAISGQQTPLMVLDGSESYPLDVTLNSNKVGIRFVAVSNVNSYRGFKIRYERITGTCSREVNAASGTLEIPANVQSSWLRLCRWKITVPKGQSVRLQFLNLADMRAVARNNTRSGRRSEIQPQFSFYNDFNQLSKITDFRIDAYNGSGIIESSDNVMLVSIITTQLDLTTIPLRARYSSSEPSQCPPDIGDQAAGSLSIKSLSQLPVYYCTINYVGLSGTTLTFKVGEYVYWSGVGPSVVFRDEGFRFVNYLSTNLTNSYISMPSTPGRITLNQGKNVKLKQFRATYRRHNCGGQMLVAEGLAIEPPQLMATVGEDYGPLECVFSLGAGRGYVLEGNLSLSDSCDREYIVIYAGPALVARLCRGMTMNSTRLGKSHSKVIYHTEEHRPGRSWFRLQPRRSEGPLAGNVIRVDQRTTAPISINGTDYKNNMELIWEFTTNAGLSLSLQFQGRFFIETSPNCSNDRLSVQQSQDRQEPAGGWSEVASLCGRQFPPPLHVEASRMRVVFQTNNNITGDGFSFTVSPSCDVTLRATAELQTQRWDWQAFRNMLNCSYVILTETQEQLVVSIKSVGRPWPAFACTRSFFKAYRQSSSSSSSSGSEEVEEELTEKFCPDFEVNGYKRLRLQYMSPTSRQFKLQYQILGCGGNYSANFSLRPPQHDEDVRSYAHNMHCEWRVTAPPQHAIVLEFKYFDLEESRNCRYDYLAVYKGSMVPNIEQRVARLCGNLTTQPPTIMVDSNQALIVSHSDSSNSFRGFLASVRFVPNCNERIALDDDLPRMSLVRNYKMNAFEQLLCIFKASATPGHRLSVQLRQLQPFGSYRGYLEIVDSDAAESQSLGKYYDLSGNRTKLFSSYSDLAIRLSGTSTLARNVSFELILQMERTICGETEYQLRSNESIKLGIQGDNGTRNYEGSVHCSWSIRSTVEAEIEIRWVNLRDVSQVTGKCLDYLRLSESWSPQYFCGQFNNTLKRLSSAENLNFQLTFHSEELTDSTGFELVIRQNTPCSRNYTELSQSIEDSALTNCTVDIRVPEGYSVTLNLLFVLFDMESGMKYLNISDLKANQTVFHTNRFLASPTVKFTSTNQLRIASTGIASMRFFYYSTSNDLPNGCGGDISMGGGFGNLANPPYDNRNHSLCTWRISVPAGSILRISFTNFNMGSETNCNLDNIKFYKVLPDASEGLVQTSCGSTIPDDFDVGSNRAVIVAKKSPNFDGLGFQFSFTLKNVS